MPTKPKSKKASKRAKGAKGAKKGTQTGYCVKCHEKRVIKNASRVTLANGRHAVKGECGVCKSTMFRFVK